MGQQDFLASTRDPAVIRQARSQLQLAEGLRTRHVNGRIVFATNGGNLGWGWRFASGEWSLADVSVEVCDGRPEDIEQDMNYWLNTVGRFCPWGSYVMAETVPMGAATGVMVKFTTPPGEALLAERVASMQQIAQARGLALTYRGEGALGVHVLDLGWRVSPSEATSLARAISSQVAGIEYAEPNLVMYPAG
jgi:hypothetical protein